jgi:hypothetical protein
MPPTENLAFILAVPPRVGLMEYWSAGMMGFRLNTPVLQFPILQYSFLHPVERPRVVAEKLLPVLRRDVLAHGNRVDELILT